MKTLKTLALASAIAGAGLPMSALAHGTAQGDRYYDYATVLSSHPAYESVQIRTPRQECWTEHVHHYSPPRPNTYTPEIVGGIVGAAVGNRFGSGRGRDVATVAGGVLGASLGHDYKNRHMQHGGYSYTQPVQRCHTTYVSHSEQRLAGYDVKYRYNGRVYNARLPHDPGSRLRVQVEVRPAFH